MYKTPPDKGGGRRARRPGLRRRAISIAVIISSSSSSSSSSSNSSSSSSSISSSADACRADSLRALLRRHTVWDLRRGWHHEDRSGEAGSGGASRRSHLHLQPFPLPGTCVGGGFKGGGFNKDVIAS